MNHRASLLSRALAAAVLMFLPGAGCHEDQAGGPGTDGGADAAMDGTAPADAAVTGDGDLAQRFPCLATTCSVTDQFCYRIEAGARMPRGPRPATADGGVVVGCNPIPSMCQPGPTCACVLPIISSCPPFSLFCQQQDGGLTITCALP